MQKEYQDGAVRVYFRSGIKEEDLPEGIRPETKDGLESCLAVIDHVHNHTYASYTGCSKLLELQLTVEKTSGCLFPRYPLLQYLNDEDIERILDEFDAKGRPERLVGAGVQAYLFKGECIGISTVKMSEKPK